MKYRGTDEERHRKKNRERFYRMVNRVRATSTAAGARRIQRAHEREQRAMKLRNEPTRAEQVLQEALAKTGLEFVHSRVVATLIVDFFCPQTRAVIEVDGSIHAKPRKQLWDSERDQILRRNGYRILRIDSRDIFRDLEGVVSKVVEFARPSS